MKLLGELPMGAHGGAGSASYRSKIGQHTRSTPRGVGGPFHPGWAGPNPPARPSGCCGYEIAQRTARRVAGGTGATGFYARVVERALERLVHALGVPRRQCAGAGGDHPPVSAFGGGAVWGGEADEDPRAGRVGGVVQGGGRTLGSAAATARGGARRRRGEHDGGAVGNRAGAGIGDRGGD